VKTRAVAGPVKRRAPCLPEKKRRLTPGGSTHLRSVCGSVNGETGRCEESATETNQASIVG
jgi:hypothetical protein